MEDSLNLRGWNLDW